MKRGFVMFEIDMIENLQKMRKIAVKQRKLVNLVRQNEMVETNFSITKRASNLIDQSDRLENIIMSISYLFEDFKVLKDLEEKFAKLV
jgi:hypothetical protein